MRHYPPCKFTNKTATFPQLLYVKTMNWRDRACKSRYKTCGVFWTAEKWDITLQGKFTNKTATFPQLLYVKTMNWRDRACKSRYKTCGVFWTADLSEHYLWFSEIAAWFDTSFIRKGSNLKKVLHPWTKIWIPEKPWSSKAKKRFLSRNNYHLLEFFTLFLLSGFIRLKSDSVLLACTFYQLM